jgi:hypothetical protein
VLSLPLDKWLGSCVLLPSCPWLPAWALSCPTAPAGTAFPKALPRITARSAAAWGRAAPVTMRYLGALTEPTRLARHFVRDSYVFRGKRRLSGENPIGRQKGWDSLPPRAVWPHPLSEKPLLNPENRLHSCTGCPRRSWAGLRRQTNDARPENGKNNGHDCTHSSKTHKSHYPAML